MVVVVVVFVVVAIVVVVGVVVVGPTLAVVSAVVLLKALLISLLVTDTATRNDFHPFCLVTFKTRQQQKKLWLLGCTYCPNIFKFN